MHIYGKDQQAFHLQRTETEVWWSRLNVLVVIVQLACFLAAIIRTSTNASNSMSNSFFSISPLQLKSPYLQVGCSVNITRSHAFFQNVTYVMRPDNVGYYVSRGTLNIRYLLALTAVFTALSMLNRLWFETNTHEIRYHFVVFRKDMMTMWEVLLMVMGLVVTFSVTKENQLMTVYVNECSNKMDGSYYHSVQPYTELIVSYIVSMAVTVINAIFAIWNLSKENPRVKLLREDKERMEEWNRAMLSHYGSDPPSNRGHSAGSGDAPSYHVQGVQPITYANNQGSTPMPNMADRSGNRHQQQQQQQQKHHHTHHAHDIHAAIRKGVHKPFEALSHSLRARVHEKDGDGLGGSGVYRSSLGPTPSSAHVGPSVSRPLTPLLDDAMDVAGGEEQGQIAVQRSMRRPPPQPQQQQQQTGGGSSNSGRYDLHEVAYDDEEEDDMVEDSADMDIAEGPPRGPTIDGGGQHFRDSAAGGAAAITNSNGSAALLHSRMSAVPPPPPAYSGDRRQRTQSARSQMLAPPSPLQGGGAETTDDTILQ